MRWAVAIGLALAGVVGALGVAWVTTGRWARAEFLDLSDEADDTFGMLDLRQIIY